MKRFIISVLSISVFFVGLGSLADHVGAKFKSDEKALEIVRKTRTALGGDAALAQVRSMVITGRTVHTFKVDNAERSEPGETEIALQFPDKLLQKIKIGNDNGTGAKVVSENHEVVIVSKDDAAKTPGNGEFTTADGKKIVIRERIPADGDATFTSEDGKKVIVRKIEGGEAGVWTSKEGEDKHVVIERSAHPGPQAHSGMKHNELLRLSLALLMTAPEGIDVNYTFVGESDIDGTAVNVINAEFGGANYKLFIGKSNNLPVAMSYRGMGMPKIMKFTKSDAPAGEAARDHVTFTKKIDAEMESVENLVKFSDYRAVGGVQLPYKWTTSVGGNVRDVFDVTSYDINPANIADRFADQKVFVRTKKADGQ
ncbi:MAG: hypothetical protein HOP17_12130 [Acidobacteria bacterium]|nr:hypothetical protein [Acidobacteriota bacterium]